MLIVAFAFAVIFLFRDVQILAMPVRKAFAGRLVTYALLLLAGIGIFATLADGRPAWTGRRFALAAIAVQLSQLTISLVLRHVSSGRFGWIGSILPSPAFLMALCALAFEIQSGLLDVNALAAVEIVTLVWLVIVGGLAAALCWFDNPWEDRKFASDFAMMTACTAVIFVPFCFP
jgi:hypothetical protein